MDEINIEVRPLPSEFDENIKERVTPILGHIKKAMTFCQKNKYKSHRKPIIKLYKRGKVLSRDVWEYSQYLTLKYGKSGAELRKLVLKGRKEQIAVKNISYIKESVRDYANSLAYNSWKRWLKGIKNEITINN